MSEFNVLFRNIHGDNKNQAKASAKNDASSKTKQTSLSQSISKSVRALLAKLS